MAFRGARRMARTVEGHRPTLADAPPERLAALAGVLAVVVAALVDVSIGSGISLLVIGPLLTAMIGRARDAAAVAVLAVAVSVPLGLVGGKFNTTGHWIAVVAVTAGGVLAVAGARLRERLVDDERGAREQLGHERDERLRADLLARAGRLLDSQFEPDAMLAELAELPVPDMADLCAIELVAPDGTLHDGPVSTATDELAADLGELRARFPIDPRGPHPVAIAARTGRSILVPMLTLDDVQPVVESDEHLELMRRLRFRSWIVVPLVAAGRTLAVLSMLRVVQPTPYVDADLRAATDLCRRAALTLENARLFSELSATERRLDATLSNLTEAVTVITRKGLVYANQAAADGLGFATPADMLAAPFPQMFRRFMVYGENGRPFPLARLPVEQVLAGETMEPAVLRVLDSRDGSEAWTLAKASPIRDGAGEVAFVVSITEDITDVKRAELAQRFLATASKLLSSSLDPDTVLDKVAWSVVPEVADWCIVHMPDERGVLRQAAFAHRDPARLALGEELATSVPNELSTIARAWREGSAQLVAEMPDGPVAGASTQRISDLLRELGMSSLAAVPMRAGDETIGVISFVTEAPRRLETWHLELVEELGRRAGVAVENTRVHAARSYIATTLQNSLLPPNLPAVPGLTIAARFRAAGGRLTEVGGDFYDLFAAAEGWMMVMGDVTGKGPDAAATTSLARYTLRTAALYEPQPSQILARLNSALAADIERRQLCTAVCVQIVPDPSTGRARVRITCAGHPPPYLLRRDEPPRLAGEPGALLGAFEDAEYVDQVLELEPHDTLVLYTDGVTDTRGARERFGQERLVEALTGVAGLGPEEIASHVDEAVLAFQEGPQRDDVALLVLRCAPVGGNGDSGAAH
jgi:GAF domain-containing protein